jgi:hypothetical protein
MEQVASVPSDLTECCLQQLILFITGVNSFHPVQKKKTRHSGG